MARLDRDVVGYGGLICYGEEAHVTNVAVDPSSTATDRDAPAARPDRRASEMGAEAVSLEVRVTNWRAQRLYGRFGFRPVGVRKNYYQEINEDALIMWLDQIREPAFRAKLAGLADALPEGVRP